MGYCNYCKKNVYSSTTCNYCNNILTVRMDSKLLEQRRDTLGNTDKWQDTYGKKSFFNNNNSTSTSKSAYMASARKRAIPQFNNTDSNQESNLKSCSQCHKNQKSWSDQNFTIYKSVYYCKPCLAQKLTCLKCNNQVNIMDPQVTFQQHTYHSDCFQCFQCSTSLCDKDAVENARGNPICTTCQSLTNLDSKQLQPHSSSMANTSTSTPLLKNVSINPLIFQRTRRSSMFTRNLPLESCTPTSTLLDKIKENTPKVTTSQSTITSSTTANRIRTPSPPIMLNRISDFTISTPLLQKKETIQMDQPAPIVSPKKTESTSRVLRRKKKPGKGPCKECGEDVSKKEYRGLETLDGEILCFHISCLKCARCHQSFDGIEFRTDGKKFYHTKCPTIIPSSTISAPIVNERKGSPCSLSEDEHCPKTPPPDINAHFDIVSTSPVDQLLPSIDNEQNNDQKKKDVITPDSPLLCDACNEPVTNTFMELGNSFYHQKCLTCTGCNSTISAGHKIRRLRDRFYCDDCATNLKRNKSVFLSNLVMNDMPKRAPTITSPSDIFKSRSTNLPRLGGCRTCDGCRKELPVSDSHPGPNATRWHKKCLKCPGCTKQMDSFGHMKTDRVAKISVVHCRECLDNMPRNNFVR